MLLQTYRLRWAAFDPRLALVQSHALAENPCTGAWNSGTSSCYASNLGGLGNWACTDAHYSTNGNSGWSETVPATNTTIAAKTKIQCIWDEKSTKLESSWSGYYTGKVETAFVYCPSNYFPAKAWTKARGFFL